MITVYNKSLNQTIKLDRLIGYFKGIKSGPTLIFIAGIHGNEPAGVFAVKKVINELEKKDAQISGNIYGISGNLSALAKGIRYQKEDLNRVWTKKRVENLLYKESRDFNDDELEQVAIYKTIQNILLKENGPFYFLDLHTTSSKTTPFLTVNDSLLNRKFAMQYPIKMILGIEEYLDGPLLSYINELGYISFGFEGGQHDDPNSIDNHISFVYLSLVFSGCIDKTSINFADHYIRFAGLKKNSNPVYEIFWQHKIRNGEVFKMKSVFNNFQEIRKGQPIAISNGNTIVAHNSGRIFMPLYQKQGDDGFFIIKKTANFFLRLSAVLRKIRFDHILPILPGVQWKSKQKDVLIINLKIARFFTRHFFHLIGYRSKQIDKTHLTVSNREAASRKNEYENCIWNGRKF